MFDYHPVLPLYVDVIVTAVWVTLAVVAGSMSAVTVVWSKRHGPRSTDPVKLTPRIAAECMVALSRITFPVMFIGALVQVAVLNRFTDNLYGLPGAALWFAVAFAGVFAWMRNHLLNIGEIHGAR